VGFEELQHTADVALRCWGPDVSGLFTAAAEGLASLIGRPGAVKDPFSVGLSAPDVETLLVDWLTELIYHAERTGGTFCRVEVVISASHELQARVWPAEVVERRGVVKAATYHGLMVEPRPEGCTATIVFDT